MDTAESFTGEHTSEERREKGINYRPDYLMMDLTMRCPIRCSHCLVDAGPHRRETLEIENVRRAIKDATGNGIETVRFCGGEPFVVRPLLYESVRETCRNGLHPQIMTNGYWGQTPETAREVFDEIRDLQREFDPWQDLSFTVSADKRHQEFLPLESSANIIIEYLRRNDVRVNVDLGIEDGETDTLQELFDRIEALSHLRVTQLQPDLFGRSRVGFAGETSGKRQVGFHYNAVSLLGRASAFLENKREREHHSGTRSEISKLASVAEKRHTLMLGVNNRFYVHPTQMMNGLGDLGENNGHQIAHAISAVNHGDVVSRILITEDSGKVGRAVRLARIPEVQTRFDALLNDGFEYEAIVSALRDHRIMDILRGTTTITN